MFGHNFKYTFKVLMRNRMLLFWTFVFPLVLGTMFKLAFSNIENSEKLNVIPIAIVDNEDFQGNEAFRRTFETLSDESSDGQMFDTVYVSKDEADTLLSDGDVDGVLYMNGAEPEIWIHENGINQTVLQYVVDEIVHTSAIMEKRVQNEIEQGTMPDIEALYKDVMEQVAGRESNLVDASRKNLSYTMIEYYTLIGDGVSVWRYPWNDGAESESSEHGESRKAYSHRSNQQGKDNVFLAACCILHAVDRACDSVCVYNLRDESRLRGESAICDPAGTCGESGGADACDYGDDGCQDRREWKTWNPDRHHDGVLFPVWHDGNYHEIYHRETCAVLR